MKHSLPIILLLLSMFFLAQLIGIAVIHAYTPEVIQTFTPEGNFTNITRYHLPYGIEPPQQNNPPLNLISIVIAFVLVIGLMLLLMAYKVEIFLRIWFFSVILIALAVTLNAFLFKNTFFAQEISYLSIPSAQFIALLIALPLAFLKVYKRNIFVHNITELFIYPGIAAILVPLLNILTVSILLILISIYDAYAVWHAGFMQKMAKYQIKTLRVFSGFFIPYLGKKERELLKTHTPQQLKNKKIKFHVAILGGGDVIFPILLSGTVLLTLGFMQALLIASGATAALACLFYFSKKGKFYPAMPFISIGCFVALALAYLI